MMNKLFITTMAGNPWGGSEELWVQMAQRFKESGDEVSALVFNWGALPEKIKNLEDLGVRIIKRKRFQFSEFKKKPWGKFVEKALGTRELNRVIRKTCPDKIIVSMGGFCDLEVDVNRNFLLSSDVPYDLIIHVNPEDYYLPFQKISSIVQACEKANTIYFVSQRLKEIAVRQTGYDFPNGKIIVNPVNMQETGILPWPSRDTLNMACVGRLDAKVKGQAILLQALAKPEWRSRNWHLNIYGKGPDEAYLKHLVKSFGLFSQVSFKGYVNDIREDIWKNNHLLVMPSYFEGLPIALVEAMLCGRPAVVTDVGGNAEILEDAVSGFVSGGVNMSSYNLALEKAYSNRSSLKEMGIEAYKSAANYNTKN